jgi:hypothetical protein
MNKEQEQIIDEVYEKYSIIAGMSTQVVSLTKDSFIHYIKTDVKFSETWGIKIEERELNHDERFEIYKKVSGRDLQPHISGINFKQFHFDESKIPTKLITLTHNNETIESYE